MNRPADLSGGQRQRVAIARELATGLKILLADEPTGSLDSDTAQDIMGLLVSLNRQQSTTVLMVNHDLALASFMSFFARPATLRRAGFACCRKGWLSKG